MTSHVSSIILLHFPNLHPRQHTISSVIITEIIPPKWEFSQHIRKTILVPLKNINFQILTNIQSAIPQAGFFRLHSQDFICYVPLSLDFSVNGYLDLKTQWLFLAKTSKAVVFLPSAGAQNLVSAFLMLTDTDARSIHYLEVVTWWCSNSVTPAFIG